jgi:hypothetical protein
MAKCTCSDAEAECKCGCGCLCIEDDSIPVQDRCWAMCYQCEGPKGNAAIEGAQLGVLSIVGPRVGRRKITAATKFTFHCKGASLGSIALALEKIAGARVAVPVSKLGAKRTVSLKGTLGDIVKRLGLISLSPS